MQKNTSAERISLWTALKELSTTIQEPQILSEDFKDILSLDDSLGSPITPTKTQDFRDFMDALQLTFLRSIGCYYSFYNKQDQNYKVYSRIYWDMSNYQWLQRYGLVEADYLLPRIFNQFHALQNLQGDICASTYQRNSAKEIYCTLKVTKFYSLNSYHFDSIRYLDGILF